MEQKRINVAELLRNCPKGMELYSPIFGEVYLDKIRPHLAVVVTTDKEQGDVKEEFLYDGRYGMNGECMLFPSKGKTTWEGFHRPFKDGDIVFYNDTIAIFKEWGDKTLFRTYVTKYLCCDSLIDINVPLFGKSVRKEARLATEEEKAKLFQAIKDNGYNWDSETKTLEKLAKFKVGDKIKLKNSPNKFVGIVTQTFADGSICINDYSWVIKYEDQDIYELVTDKFDISTLKPFDKVLVRDTNEQVWVADFFSHKVEKQLGGYTFACVGHYPDQCIPFEQNEHLRGTTDDCDEFYKVWDK